MGAGKIGDKATKLKNALNEIFRLSQGADRATFVGTAAGAGALAAGLGTVVLAGLTGGIALPVLAALGAGTAAVSLFKKLQDIELTKKLLEQDSFTETEKNFLKEFEEKLESNKTEEGKKSVLELYSEKVAEIVHS